MVTSATSAIDWAVAPRRLILHQEINGHPLIYFDSAATSQKARAILNAITRYCERDDANVHRGVHELSNRAIGACEAARERVAKFLHAQRTGAVLDYILVTGVAGTLDPSGINGNGSPQIGIFSSSSIERFVFVRELYFRWFSLPPRNCKAAVQFGHEYTKSRRQRRR